MASKDVGQRLWRLTVQGRQTRGARYQALVGKAYNIGPGRLIPYSDFTAAPQGETALEVIQPFGPATQRGRVGESVRQKSEIYPCHETGCVLTFKTQAQGDDHMDTGKHQLEVDSE